MAPTFFAQLAAGCLLVVGVSDIRNSGWKYLRLMALVSFALVFMALLLITWRDSATGSDSAAWNLSLTREVSLRALAIAGLSVTLAFTVVWLVVNTVQAEAIRSFQRIWPFVAGAACIIASAALACRPDSGLPGARLVQPAGGDAVRAAMTTVLGALVLGGVTAGMLLGHRYLTDTDMPIAPLRRLTNIYLVALIVRIIWVAVLAWPIYGSTFTPSGGAMWIWIVLTIRGGVGLLGAAIFAWMIRDCVKTRATQSATAIFYLSMVFVYLGELAAQYLLRTEGLAV